MNLGKIAQKSLSTAAVFGLLSFGACTLSLPALLGTNGISSVGNSNAKTIEASAKAEFLFGLIGINESGEDKARDEIRESLNNQCSGGKIQNISSGVVVHNYWVYEEYVYTEHASCIMPKS